MDILGYLDIYIFRNSWHVWAMEDGMTAAKMFFSLSSNSLYTPLCTLCI